MRDKKICCKEKPYKKINTTIAGKNQGKKPICKNCYIELLGGDDI